MSAPDPEHLAGSTPRDPKGDTGRLYGAAPQAYSTFDTPLQPLRQNPTRCRLFCRKKSSRKPMAALRPFLVQMRGPSSISLALTSAPESIAPVVTIPIRAESGQICRCSFTERVAEKPVGPVQDVAIGAQFQLLNPRNLFFPAAKVESEIV